MSRLRQKDEFFRTIAPPARGDRDTILLIDGMPELSGIEAFGLRIDIHGLVEQWPTLLHLTPPLTTSGGDGQ